MEERVRVICDGKETRYEKYTVSDEELLKEKQEQEKYSAECEVRDLRRFLDTDWRWKFERLQAELYEIELGERKDLTISKEELIIKRKTVVARINELRDKYNIE